MNADKLSELRGRAERATAVANDIEALTNADPHQGGVRCSFTHWNTGAAFLGDGLLLEMLAMGRLVLLEKKEAELMALLDGQASEPLSEAPNQG